MSDLTKNQISEKHKQKSKEGFINDKTVINESGVMWFQLVEGKCKEKQRPHLFPEQTLNILFIRNMCRVTLSHVLHTISSRPDSTLLHVRKPSVQKSFQGAVQLHFSSNRVGVSFIPPRLECDIYYS